MNSPAYRAAARVADLRDEHLPALRRLCDTDPIVNVVVAARLDDIGSLHPARFGGSVLGTFDRDGRLTAALVDAGNLVPVGGGRDEWRALAGEVARRSPTSSSLVGPAPAVAALWAVLEPVWGPSRALRAVQPVLAVDARHVPTSGADPRVRLIEPAELDAYLPAAAAMFTEELEISPFAAGGEAAYRRRIDGLIRARRALGIIDDHGDVVFKADIGSISADACQLQGVWVRPDLRGRGLGTAAFAAVLRHAAQLAPTVSLYVNDFNLAARRLYARLGMQQVATFTTVLL